MTSQQPAAPAATLALLLCFTVTLLAGCNYPAKTQATEMPVATATSLPPATRTTSNTPEPTVTPEPSATPSPTMTTSPSVTPSATTTPLPEQAGVVVLNGIEIGTIQKSGENFTFVPNKHHSFSFIGFTLFTHRM